MQESQTHIKDSIKTVAKASIIVAVVAGLSGVIYIAMRDSPKHFSIITPFTSQSVPTKKEVPQPIRRFPWTTIQKLK